MRWQNKPETACEWSVLYKWGVRNQKWSNLKWIKWKITCTNTHTHTKYMCMRDFRWQCQCQSLQMFVTLFMMWNLKTSVYVVRRRWCFVLFLWWNVIEWPDTLNTHSKLKYNLFLTSHFRSPAFFFVHLKQHIHVLPQNLCFFLFCSVLSFICVMSWWLSEQ